MRKVKWGEFKLTDVFDVKNTKNILSSDIVENSGTTPYLCASSENNAVSTYIKYNENFLENSQNSQSLQNFHNFQNSNEQISINQSSSQNPMLGSDVPQIETPPRVLRNGNNNLNLNLNLDRNRENR